MGQEDDAEVPMSPLIDCVFLLLIFFLVTTMLKRKEKLIPIELPDNTSAVAARAYDETLIIGLDANGAAYRASGAVTGDGAIIYEPVDDLAAYLKSVIESDGATALQRPLRIDADRNTPFQTAIDMLDVCKLQGFTNVGVKTRGRAQ